MRLRREEVMGPKVEVETPVVCRLGLSSSLILIPHPSKCYFWLGAMIKSRDEAEG